MVSIWGRFVSQCYPYGSIIVVIYPIEVVYFYNVSYQHLELLEKYWGLRSVIEDYPFNFCACKFFGGLLSCCQIHYQFPHKLLQLFPLVIIGSICSCLRFADVWPLFWRRSGGIIVPCSPCVTGVLKLSEVLLHYFEWCPRKSSPWLLFLLSYDLEGIDGLSSLLSDELYFCGRLSSFSVRRKV